MTELNAALRKHKEIMKGYPRRGEGLEAFVDASDTGYTVNAKPAEDITVKNIASKSLINDDVQDASKTAKEAARKDSSLQGAVDGSHGKTNGVNGVNGHTNGITNGPTNGVSNGVH